jgi:aldehyde:ferredoxin oxidoreductase
MGKILRVDLSSGSIKDENSPEEPVLRKLIGGQALATYILLKELPLDARPLGPENRVVIMTGPITGTGLTPGGTKATAVYLSPLTGYTLGRGATSGFWGTYLKAAGYDGVIIEGAASKPVYLFIHEGRAEIRDAGRLWGYGTRATEDRLREEVALKDAKVLWPGRGTSQPERHAGQRLQSQRCPQRRGALRLEETQSDRGLWNGSSENP